MARFDDSGMHRPDRDFVDLRPFDPVEIEDSHAGAVAAAEANGLEPGMTFGLDPVVLREFAFEEGQLRTFRGERRIRRRRESCLQT